jgi:iron complex transport system substrate-binding protein
MPTIVSLLPAATDIVAALGAGELLVGRTHECDWPADLVRDIPIVTETSLPQGLSSREIADAVGSAPHTGSSIYQLDLDALTSLQPDVIITQDLCEMCAVSYRSINDAVRVTGLATTIISLDAGTIDEILDSIDVVGELLDIAPAAARLVTDLRGRLGRLPGPGANAPRVFFIEWFDPLMPGGHWVPEQIALAGGISVPLGPGAHSVPWQWSAVADLEPEVIILGPCGFTPEQTRAELPALFARPEWATLPAVRNGQVWIVDGPAYFNRPGPRVVDGAEILAAILSGDAERTGVAERVARPVA